MSDTVKDRFNRLREQALKKEEKLKEQPVIRIGTASCGVAAGALKTREAFQKLLQERGLPARVMEVGCLGHCYAEPPGHYFEARISFLLLRQRG